MLIALITVLYLGGGVQDATLDYIKVTEGKVDEIISEPDRRSEIKLTLSDMKNRSEERADSAKKLVKQLEGNMSEYDLAQEQIDAILDEYLTLLTDYNEDIIDLRFELRNQMSREEWRAFFGHEGQP